MNINEIKHGFKLISIQKVNDINSTLYQYEHIKSGGKVVYLANDDTNCCFAIGFKTLPEDSTGVCHIIEHSLLCGSKKYPLKEPFVNLLKSSLATFLNAFTAYDWTMYPFASQTPKDFDNILKVYLDAVFNPLSMVDEKPFLQEGWHIELLNEDDTPSYKGVVYNEMKGAMSSVDEVLTQSTLQAMYKDTFYRHNSGGDPDVIPSLTYEAYKDFYHRHYTPQNAMTYFYGKMDIEEKLAFLDKEYFSKYERSLNKITIEAQTPLIDTSYEAEYEISPEEDEKDNAYMSLCYGLDNFNNYEDFLAMNVVCEALLAKNDSPLKKALLDASLGQNVVYRIDDDNIIPALHVYLQKTNPNKKQAFKDVFVNEVKKVVENGIDKELLLATINHFEFKEKEMDTGRMPKGLIYAMTMMSSFNYDGDLVSHLEFTKHYNKFREKLNDNYFEKLLAKYILNSNHYVQVLVKPSKTLGQRKKQEMDDKMANLKETLTLEEKRKLVKQTNELIAYQNHVDTKEELATLPSLKIKDIPSKINYLASKKAKVNGMDGFVHTLNTNSIAYLRMYFDLNSIAFEDLPYVILLKALFKNVKTNKYEVSKLNNLIKTYLGDLAFSEIVLSSSKDDYQLYFKVTASALLENVSYLPEIINEVLLHSKFTKKEVYRIAKQITNNLRQGVIENGMGQAIMMSRRHYSLSSAIQANAFSGPLVYDFYNNLINNFDYQKINKKLKEIVSKVFNKKNVKLSMSGDQTTVDELLKSMKKLKLPLKSYKSELEVKVANIENEALIIPSEVSYNAMSNNLECIGKKYEGKYAVLAQIVNYDYLWAEIRVKGGAYGCSLSIGKNGDVSLGSYRDPNVKNTYDVYDNLTTYLKNFKVSKEIFNSYIIGTMSNFDVPASTPSFINEWDINYLLNVSKKDKENLKKQVLKTKIDDINSCHEIFEKFKETSSKYTIGNSSKISNYQFDKVKSLS